MALPILTAASQCPRAAISHELAAAREKLSLSKRTYDHVARQLEQLKKSGRTDPRVLQDYTAYLQRVQDLVDENRRIVRKLEALCAPAVDMPGTTAGEKRIPPSATVPPREKDTDKLTALDRELQHSLASFDEMLLKRINAIQAESADKMRDLAQQAAQAAGRARQHGSTTAGQSSGTSEGEEGKQGSDGSQGQKGAQGGENARQGKNTSQDRKAGSMGPTAGNGKAVPSGEVADRQGKGRATSQTSAGAGTGAATTRAYNPDDDDIVARQLREAAEQETDPELKKKLWKEYEKYRKNTRP